MVGRREKGIVFSAGHVAGGEERALVGAPRRQRRPPQSVLRRELSCEGTVTSKPSVGIHERGRRMDREGSPDYVLDDDHPLRQEAVQSLALLQVPKSRSRNVSISSSVTDLDAPMFVRESTTPPYRQRQGCNSRLAFAIAAAALGSSFQHGYNTGVVNAPQKLIEQWIRDIESNRSDIEPWEVEKTKVTMIWSIAVSIFCVGGMIGGSITSIIAERLGRKGGLMVNNVLVLLSAILQGCAQPAESYEMIIIGRFLIGINSGLNAGLVPMYLSEISPAHLRGAIGTVYQLVITISILISQILGLETILGNEAGWPILLALTIVPGIFQVITLPFCPESPKYLLLSKGLDIEAQRALSWLRGTIEVHDEMDEMRAEYEASKSVPKVNLRDMFMNPALRIPLLISMMIMVCQQLSGINAVFFFSTKIFMLAKLSELNAQYATLGMGAINVLMTLVSLVLVEKAGRKTLLLIGFSGMCICTMLLTICLVYVESSVYVSYFAIFLVIFFVVMFATGPGSIPWFLVSELFNQSARSAATSCAVAINWTANFIVGITFLPLAEVLHGYVFIIFTILLAFFVLFVYRKVPETKNKTMEEISAMFRQRSYE